MLRAKRITPPGCSVASVVRRWASMASPSNPRMSSWPTCRRRSVVVFLGIGVDYTEAEHDLLHERSPGEPLALDDKCGYGRARSSSGSWGTGTPACADASFLTKHSTGKSAGA